VSLRDFRRTLVFRPVTRFRPGSRPYNNCLLSDEIFDAGIDHTAAAVEERKRLEREATDFDIWRSADFLPEEDPNDGELLLDELERDDILSELLQNTRMCISIQLSHINAYCVFG